MVSSILWQAVHSQPIHENCFFIFVPSICKMPARDLIIHLFRAAHSLLMLILLESKFQQLNIANANAKHLVTPNKIFNGNYYSFRHVVHSKRARSPRTDQWKKKKRETAVIHHLRRYFPCFILWFIVSSVSQLACVFVCHQFLQCNFITHFCVFLLREFHQVNDKSHITTSSSLATSVNTRRNYLRHLYGVACDSYVNMNLS